MKEIDIGHKIWGHVFEFELSVKVTHEIDAIEILDEFCSINDLNEIYYHWNKININNALNLLKNCLTFDLAHNSRINEEQEVDRIFKNIISNLDLSAVKFCFANCTGSPFQKSMNGFSWNNLTDQTFDIGVVLMDSKKAIFAYFMGES